MLFSGWRAPAARLAGFFVSGLFLLALFVVLFALAPFAHASQTNGTISTTYKYAWSDVAGYVNFAPTHSVVSVTDTGLSGYVWSENDGWINLSPSNGGVTNNGNGTLGGFAWDSLKGWVSFTGVTIDSSGKFHGKAVGANETISFDCTHCDVRTDWRPVSARTTKTVTSYGFVPVAFSTPNPLPGKQISVASTAPSATLPNATASSSGKQVALFPPETPASASSVSPTPFIPSTSQNQSGFNSLFPSTNTGTLPPAISPPASSSGSAVRHASTTANTANTAPVRTSLYVGGGILILLIIFFITRFLFV